VGKLERFPSMSAARMQDYGGCRAVLKDVASVEAVVESFLSARHKHKLLRHDDYLLRPKASGYRGVHLAYSYRSGKANPPWNGLTIEVQIRSRLQHAWATAVETVGLFTNQALKSSLGESDWLRFFQVMSSAIALREGMPTLSETSSDPVVLKAELEFLASKLEVVQRLGSYAQLLKESEEHMANAKFGFSRWISLEKS
jgi:hypothetical protein